MVGVERGGGGDKITPECSIQIIRYVKDIK